MQLSSRKALAYLAVIMSLSSSTVYAGKSSISATYATIPTSYDYEYNGNSLDSTDYDSASRITLMYQYMAGSENKVSFIIGAGLDLVTQKLPFTTEDQFGIRIEPGAAFNLNQNFRIETVGAFAIGTSTFDDLEGDGAWVEFGFTVRPVYAFNSGFSLMAQVSFISHATAYEYDDGSDDLSTQTGFSGGVGIGYRF